MLGDAVRHLSVAYRACPIVGYGDRVRPLLESSKHLRKSRADTVNVNTLKGRVYRFIVVAFFLTLVVALYRRK